MFGYTIIKSNDLKKCRDDYSSVVGRIERANKEIEHLSHQLEHANKEVEERIVRNRRLRETNEMLAKKLDEQEDNYWKHIALSNCKVTIENETGTAKWYYTYQPALVDSNGDDYPPRLAHRVLRTFIEEGPRGTNLQLSAKFQRCYGSRLSSREMAEDIEAVEKFVKMALDRYRQNCELDGIRKLAEELKK